MTLAVTAQGDKFEIQIPGEGSAGTWKTLQELKTAPAIGTTSSPIDATSLDDTCIVNIEGLNDYGTLEFTFNAQPAKVGTTAQPNSNVAILQSLTAPKYNCRYTIANLGIQITFNSASVNWQVGAASVNAVREINVQLTLTTAPVIETVSA